MWLQLCVNGGCDVCAQVVITPTAMCPKSTEWYQMQISKGCPDKSLKIKIAIRIDRPQNMKHAGYVSQLCVILRSFDGMKCRKNYKKN